MGFHVLLENHAGFCVFFPWKKLIKSLKQPYQRKLVKSKFQEHPNRISEMGFWKQGKRLTQELIG